MDDLQKPIDNQNTVTVGSICLSCGLLSTRTCPYENHKKVSVLEYKGDIRGKCSYYQAIVMANKEGIMKKSAKQMTDSELNIEIYRKIFALSKEKQTYIENYWATLFPREYAHQMVDNVNNSVQENSDKGLRTTVKKDPVSKPEPSSVPKNWFKKQKENKNE